MKVMSPLKTGQAGTPLLEASSLEKAFGGLKAVNGASLEVASGTIHGVIGPNGAGKTTLFDLITGRQRPSGGNVRLDGSDITGVSPDALARIGLVRTFQITSVFARRTVHENVALAVRAHSNRSFAFLDGFRKSASERIAVGKILDALSISPLEWSFVDELGHGQQRLVELAIAMALDPRLMFLDEPAAGMSAEDRVKLALVIKRLQEDLGVTVVIVEHDLELMMGLADQITVIHQGQTLLSGTPGVVQQDERVKNAYLGRSRAAVPSEPVSQGGSER